MKNTIMTMAGLLLLSCGSNYQLPANEQLGSTIGEQANFARSHLSDRGFSSENVDDKYVATKNNIGEYANERRKAASDAGVSSEHGNNYYNDKKDSAGKKANEVRKYLNERGLQEIREGDQESTDRLTSLEKENAEQAETIAEIEALNQEQDERLTAIEVLNALQEEALFTQETALVDVKADVETVSSSLDNFKEDMFEGLERVQQSVLDNVATLEQAIFEGDEEAEEKIASLQDSQTKINKKIKKLKKAVKVLKRTPDKVCSVRYTTVQLEVFSRTWYAPHRHYHTYSRIENVRIPTISCPGNRRP